MNENKDIELGLRKFVAPEYIFGDGARFLAANYCKKLGVNKLLLVTDNNLLNSKWFIEVKNSLIEAEIDFIIFSNISPNPRDYEVMEGAEIFIKEKCNLILSIGGGSVNDGAKGIGIIATNNGVISDYQGVDMIKNPIPPIICIPTTAGASADVSQFAIINNFQEKYKMALISKALVPDVALIDPFVLTSMDGFLTACTGMDALSHAMEAFVSNANSSFTDLYAIEAMKLIHENLINSYNNLNNIQYRGKMMLASLYAGLAFSNASLGVVHSLAHSLGGYLDLAHGECNAILLPHVVDYNYSAANDRFTKIADIFEIETKNLNSTQIKNELMNYLQILNSNIGINSSLKEKSVTLDIIPTLAVKAIKDACNATNPKSPKRGDLEVIYKEAM